MVETVWSPEGCAFWDNPSVSFADSSLYKGASFFASLVKGGGPRLRGGGIVKNKSVGNLKFPTLFLFILSFHLSMP